MSVDKRFALIDRDGAYRFPYKKTQKETGRYGFVLGRDRFGQGEYTDSLERVVRAVVLDGLGVRVKAETAPGKGGNTLSLHAQQEIVGYWLAPELLPLVVGAKFRPINEGAAARGRGQSLLDRVDSLNAAEYIRAIEGVSTNMTASQRAMLLGHASAPGRVLSMEAIARLGGYEDYVAANIQYGTLGRLFASYFGLEGLENQTQALATQGERDEEGRWQWVLRPALSEALIQLGLVEGDVDSFGRADAARELDHDLALQGVSETTRQALINARIGQGGYRKRMLKLWGGKCAVTGCSVEQVLVASHAKSWAESSNDERLDEFNGLLLAASVDRLFDAGLISFDARGSLLVSDRLSDDDLERVGLSRESKLAFIFEKHKLYLHAHRKHNGFRS